MSIRKTTNNLPFYIAGIGASAGGLEVLQKLLLNLPADIDNVAFVVAQHLSPSYKSMLADTLRRQTSLKVVEVTNSVVIKKRTVYITPANSEIIIKNGKLQLSAPIRTSAARPSIDNLFVSIAKEQHKKAIGIVLSGSGIDGAKGIQMIKDAGGFTFAQEPGSAKYDSMPLAAIETGKVDFVLTPEKIGLQLKALIKSRGKIVSKTVTEKSGNGFNLIIEALAKKTGTDFTNYKLNTLYRRITKRLAQLKIETPQQYLSYLEKTPEEVDHLFYTVLIGLTGFFRDAEVFKSLDKVLAAIIGSRSVHDPIRVWVVGCATGEEAYSVAISVAAIQKAKGVYQSVQIIATDINDHSLEIARKGVYAKKNLQHLPVEILRNYFTSLNGNYVISKAIRSMVLFSKHDLSNNPPFLKLDLIVCRNLLIYFNSRLQNHVFPVFHSALLSNGYLLLGKSESVGHFNNLFSVVDRTAKIYQRKATAHMPKVQYAPFKLSEKFTPATKTEISVPELVKENLFRVFEWPYVVVTDTMELQEIHGDVSMYLGLKPGQMNASLVKLAHKDLKIELRSVVNKCIISNKEVKGTIKKIEISGKDYYVKITVYPLGLPDRPDKFYMVIFEALKNIKTGKPTRFIPSGKNDAGRIAELELELESLKEDLQTYVERLENTNAELQSTNEEFQAANEELKISNEELETTNEELQSANEEINIAYTELKEANEALEIHDAALRKSEANVNALLSNTLQAFVLLDAQYKILAFNSVAHNTFKNIFGKKIEVGDSFKHLISHDMSHYFFDEIEQAFKGKVVISEKEIKTPKGKSFGFIISCAPVLDEDKKVQALSFSLLDITELKATKTELIKSQELINSVFHTADIGIAVVDENGKYVKTNDGYNKLFGYAKGEMEGKYYHISIPPGMKKESMELFDRLLAGNKEDGDRIAKKKNGELLTVYRTSSLINNKDGSKYLVVTARDISETKKYQHLLQNTETMMHMAGWEMDPVTEKMTCTEEFFNIIEMSKEHFNDISFDEMVEQLVLPDSLSTARKMKYEAIKLGKNVDFEIPIITPNQRKKWIRITCAPERVKSTIVGLSGIIHDITLKKKAELQLERLSLVASKTNNAVFITDEFGRTVWVNESVEKMTGYLIDEMLGKKPGAILQGPGTDKMTVSRISERLKQQLPVSEVIKNYKKDGTPFWINMDIAPVIDNNKLVNFIGIGVDITELIKAKEEQQLKESLMQQQKIFNAIANKFPDGIIGVLDNRFHYVFVGGSEIKKLGLTEKDFKNQHIFDHLSEESNTEAEPFLKRAFAGERVIFEVEMKGQIYLINAVPLSGGEYNEPQILVVLYNITNRKKVEKDLEKALEKERELSELKSRFISMASHEFRTPLSTVLSSAYLIEKYSRTAEQAKREKHLQHIVSSVNMLTDILNDFLSVGKIEEGKIQLKLSRFHIDELVKSITGELKNILKRQQKIKFHHLGNPEVAMDISLLKHIIINLISNASKFSPEGSIIEIKTKNQQEKLVFSIKDNGIGISKEDQQHLMQRFFRGANASNIQGTGLGLHIVSKYAELMNGVVECKSELEKGTEFKITFNNKIPGYEKDFAH